MRLASILPQAAVLVVFMTVGCSSNHGKIEGTSWTSQAATTKVQEFPSGFFAMEFQADGSFTQTVFGREHTGRYRLGMGDTITLNLDQPMDGHKKLQSKFIINGAAMTMQDSDGTTVLFTKVN